MTPAAPTRVAVLAGVVVALDRSTKLIVLGRLEPGVPIRVIDGFLSLTLVLNPGLASGLLASVPAEWRWVVALLSVGALVILVQVALRVLPRGRWPDHGAIGLIFGGAVGNLIDRARFGAVADFVDVYYRGWHWPAFTVAASAIPVGVTLPAIRLLGDRASAPRSGGGRPPLHGAPRSPSIVPRPACDSTVGSPTGCRSSPGCGSGR